MTSEKAVPAPVLAVWTLAVVGLLAAAVFLVTGGDPAGKTDTPTAKVAFASCAAAKAAGYTSIHKGEPGYSAKLDADGDGVACDTKMTFAECQASAVNPLGGRYAVEYDNGVCKVQRP